MKKLFILMLCFFATSKCINAQTLKMQEETKVNQTISRLFDGIATIDTSMMQQCITADFLLLEDGSVWNMDTLISILTPLKKMPFTRTNHLNFIQTKVKGNFAWVAYNNAADISVNGQDRNVQWLETAVLIKDGKDWKVQLLHSTVIRPKKN